MHVNHEVDGDEGSASATYGRRPGGVSWQACAWPSHCGGFDRFRRTDSVTALARRIGGAICSADAGTKSSTSHPSGPRAPGRRHARCGDMAGCVRAERSALASGSRRGLANAQSRRTVVNSRTAMRSLFLARLPFRDHRRVNVSLAGRTSRDHSACQAAAPTFIGVSGGVSPAGRALACQAACRLLVENRSNGRKTC